MNKIVIPKDIRDELDLETGDDFKFRIENDEIVLKRTKTKEEIEEELKEGYKNVENPLSAVFINKEESEE